MLGRLPPTTVFGKVLTLLEGPGLLQERFLGMQSYRAAFVLSSGHALETRLKSPAVTGWRGG